MSARTQLEKVTRDTGSSFVWGLGLVQKKALQLLTLLYDDSNYDSLFNDVRIYTSQEKKNRKQKKIITKLGLWGLSITSMLLISSR